MKIFEVDVHFSNFPLCSYLQHGWMASPLEFEILFLPVEIRLHCTNVSSGMSRIRDIAQNISRSLYYCYIGLCTLRPWPSFASMRCHLIAVMSSVITYWGGGGCKALTMTMII